MAPRKKPTEELRNLSLLVKFTKAERDSFYELCRKLNKTQAEVIREAIKHYGEKMLNG